MKHHLTFGVALGAVLLTLAGCKDSSAGPSVEPGSPLRGEKPLFTAGSGTTVTLLGRTTFRDPSDQVFKVKTITRDWHMEIKSMPAFDLVVQNVVFQAGGHSGWHSHPGPLFIQVVSGTITFYEADDPTCTPIVRTAGQGYVEQGEHSLIARNETALPASSVATLFAPPGAAGRIDQPNPGNCPF
jgi:hypothetical protein